MKLVIFAVTMMLATNAFAKTSCSTKENVFLQTIQDRFSRGFNSRTDVATAQLNYLDAQLLCKEISKADYCAQAILAANVQLVGTEDDGHKSVQEVAAAQKEFRTITAFCK